MTWSVTKRYVTDGRVTAGLGLYSFVIVALLLTSGMGALGKVGADGTEPAAGFRARVFERSVSLLMDDGFYYLGIARNVARGSGSTFSGGEPTNGYHPLWMLTLVPLFWLTESVKTALVASVLLQAGLMTAGAGVAYRTARLTLGRLPAAVTALCWIALTYRLALSGLEFGLQALCLLATAFVYRRRFGADPPSLRYFLGLGGLLALSFLARLETVALAGTIGLLLLLRQARAGFDRSAIHRLVAFAAPITLAVAGYGLANLWLFGGPLPVSAYIKRVESAEYLAHDPHYASGGWLVAKLALVSWWVQHTGWSFVLAMTAGTVGAGALLTAGILARRRRAWNAWSKRHLFPWTPFILFSLAQLVASLTLYHSGLSFQPWYFVVQPWLAALGIGVVLETSRRWVRKTDAGRSARLAWLIPPVAVLLLLAGPLLTARSLWAWESRMRLGLSPAGQLAYEPLDAAALWLRSTSEVPADAVVGAWNAGAIGYLSGRTVVNLDGLVNSWEFARRGRLDLCAYGRMRGITYLVDVWTADAALPDALRGCADRLEPIWVGPAHPDRPDRRAIAYRIRWNAR